MSDAETLDENLLDESQEQKLINQVVQNSETRRQFFKSYLERVDAELEAKLKEFHQIEEEIQNLQRQQTTLTSILEIPSHTRKNTPRKNFPKASNPTLPIPASSILRDTFQTVEVVDQILKEHDHPMHYRVIYSAMTQKKLYITGKDPANSMLTRIRNRGQVVRSTERGIYMLQEWHAHSTTAGKTDPATCPLCAKLNAD